MKQTLCFLTLCFLSISCQTGREGTGLQKSTAISIVADVTDKKILWPVISPVLKLYHCEENPDAAYQFNLTIITDKKLNPSFSYQLTDASKTENENLDVDPQFRNKNIIAFYTLLRKCVDSFYHHFDTTTSLNYSECWATICNQLRKLAEDKFNRKYLLVFSDLMEKSTFNAYTILSRTDPKAIARQFMKIAPLPGSLQGITVIFIYEPETRDNDKKYNTISSIYKKLLEERGARVFIQADNFHFDYE